MSWALFASLELKLTNFFICDSAIYPYHVTFSYSVKDQKMNRMHIQILLWIANDQYVVLTLKNQSKKMSADFELSQKMNR